MPRRDWIVGAYPGAEAIFLQGCVGDIKPAAIQPSAPGQRGRLNSTILLDERGSKEAMGYELGRAVCKALAVPPAPVPAGRPEDITEAVNSPVVLGGIVELVDIPAGQCTITGARPAEATSESLRAWLGARHTAAEALDADADPADSPATPPDVPELAQVTLADVEQAIEHTILIPDGHGGRLDRTEPHCH